MKHLYEVVRKALIEEYGEDFVFVKGNEEGFYVEDEDIDLGLEVIIRTTT